jgi:hypothetical protein
VQQADQAFLTWDFHFGLGTGARPRELVVRGCTQLRFDAAGLVDLHHDYWDAAGELYAQLPLIGAPMRLLRRRLSARG